MSSRRLGILLPILLALYPVLFLWAGNVRHTVLDDVLRSLLLAVALGAICLGLASVVLRDRLAGAVVAASIVTAVLFLFPSVLKLMSGMASVIPSDGGSLLYGRYAGLVYLIVAATGIAAVIVLVSSAKLRPHLPAFNGAASLGVLVLLAFPMTTLAGYFLSTPPIWSGGPSGIAAARIPSRDIYYVILDRYGTNDALQAAFGVTNNDLPDWLAAEGFFVAPQANANYDSTRLSLAATLNLDFLDSVVASAGVSSGNFTPIHEMIQDHKVGRFLKEQGFEYVHLGNWYAPTSRARIADRNLDLGSVSEFEAKLYEQTALPAIEGLIDGLAPAPEAEILQFDTARFQFAALSDLADQPGRRFVFAHVLLPHEPYVFAADGSYFSASERAGLSVDERFRDQLAYTNGEVKKLVQHLLAAPEAERPIVIIQADEGPYPPDAPSGSDIGWAAATDDQLRTKFGILDALYLPHDASDIAGEPAPYGTISSVNTFRLVFDKYFGTDLPLLPDRSFVARTPTAPYDLIDVTDRLAAP